MVLFNKDILKDFFSENIHNNRPNFNINSEEDMIRSLEILNNQNVPSADIKYKTELCRTWIENNFCPYLEKCRFAHGKTDLNDKIIFGKNYKQKDCKSFHTKGYCPYGPRCLFRHDERKFSELNRPFYKYILEKNFANISSNNLKRKKISEEDFIDNYDITEILKLNPSGNPSNRNNCSFVENENPNNSINSSNRKSNWENSQNLLGSITNTKNKLYTPNLNIFKKIRQMDSFSFDSTDVDIDVENTENNLNISGIGNFTKVNFYNFNPCSKNRKNLNNANKINNSSKVLIGDSIKNSKNVDNINQQNYGGKKFNNNNFFLFDKSFEKKIKQNVNFNNNTNNISFNCQKNFPNLINNNDNKTKNNNLLNLNNILFINNNHINPINNNYSVYPKNF